MTLITHVEQLLGEPSGSAGSMQRNPKWDHRQSTLVSYRIALELDVQ
jgi:hypothetical protein